MPHRGTSTIGCLSSERLEITGFKSFADYTEIIFTGSGITAVVGPNGCGKSNVSDAMAWVLGEQRAKSLRGGEMKDIVFAGTKNRKPGGMAEVVLHLVRDNTVFDSDEAELEDIDGALGDIDERSVDMAEIEAVEIQPDIVLGLDVPEGEAEALETVRAAQVGSTQVIETKIKTNRHWRPRSFALDFAPGEAVSVTRRLYLSGESEYQLNGKTCRLRDITDLFAGTGLSGAHYAIIEQGRIGQILSAKPADRRNLIEEAAGISKFRARQRAAESRLDSAKSNLGRITDIVVEVEKQVNSLRRQAAKTRRFKFLQEEFRDLLRKLYAAEGAYLSRLSDDLKEQLSAASGIEDDLRAGVEQAEESARGATQAARDAEESLAELRKIHAHNALERDRAEREHHYKSDQIVGLNSRCETLKIEIGASEQRLAALGIELERLAEAERYESSEHERANAEFQASADASRAESEALAAIERKIETMRAALTQHTAAVGRFDEISRQVGQNLDRLVSRAGSLEKESARAAVTYTENRQHAEELTTALTTEEKKLAELNAEKDGLITATTEARNLAHASEAELKGLSDEYSAKSTRLATLVELEEKRALYAPQVQKLFSESKNLGITLHGVLADRLDVSADAETAIEALLGPFLEAVIVESMADAKKVGTWLRQNNVGRTAMLVLPADDGGQTRVADDSTIAGKLGAPRGVIDVLRRIFPREMSARLIDTLDAASAGGDEVLVDREGDMLIGGSLFIGGKRSSSGKNSSLLAFKRELSQLEKECKRLDGAIDKARGRSDRSRADLVDLESKTVDLQSLIIKVDRGIHGLQIQVRAATDEISRAERHSKVVNDEIGQIASEIEDLRLQKLDAEENKTSADVALGDTTLAIESVASDLGEARTRAERANAVHNEKRMIAATSEERRRSAVAALRRVENEAKEISGRIEVQKFEYDDAELRIRSLHDEIGAITDRISSAGDKVVSEDAELTAALAALTESRQMSDRKSEELADLNRDLGTARNARAEIEIRQAEAITELKNAAENCQQELNIPLPQLVDEIAIEDDFDLAASRRSAADLRERLDGFGAINMLALEELGETEERHLFLTSQKQDIVDSIAATEEALREIKQRSREKFRTAFEAINTHFSAFFQELFGGGRGEMTLLESEDILEAGIEVVAQPPGKRLQNIMLLSGGEKAMTAIALVLAIFKYRPSPFCLLDEVDAPLDEANVGRFAGKIAEMSENTQFIVITHNKRTMEAARALYGVTMEDAGVSKVVSVKFD